MRGKNVAKKGFAARSVPVRAQRGPRCACGVDDLPSLYWVTVVPAVEHDAEKGWQPLDAQSVLERRRGGQWCCASCAQRAFRFEG